MLLLVRKHWEHHKKRNQGEVFGSGLSIAIFGLANRRKKPPEIGIGLSQEMMQHPQSVFEVNNQINETFFASIDSIESNQQVKQVNMALL